MRIVIFGATGSVGSETLKQASPLGHDVTALVRDPSKLDRLEAKPRVVTGNARDPDAVKAAIAGQDAVICTLGDGRKGSIRARGTWNIVRAMEELGVRRLVCQSTLGVGESYELLDFFWKRIMFGFVLRRAFNDHVEQERCVRSSDLDWTIVRPAAFTDGPKTRTYWHGTSIERDRLTLKISRADVADFLLKQLTDTSYLRSAAGLSYLR